MTGRFEVFPKLTHEKKALKHGLCDQCGKYFITTTVLKMHKFSHTGAKPLPQVKLWVLKVYISKTNIPGEAHVYSHRRKAIDCDRCGKYFITSPVLKMHKFCRSGAKPFFKGKLWVEPTKESHHINSNRRENQWYAHTVLFSSHFINKAESIQL